MWFKGPLGFLFGQFLGRGYQTALPLAMETIRRQAEQPIGARA
jgi:hypothetical protein